MAALVSIFTGGVFVYLLFKLLGSGKRGKHLPPGPPTYPIIGNIPSLPLHHQFTQWAKQYGDIYSVKIGAMTMVILSSVEAIRQVIERNTTLTADRPPNHFANVTISGSGEHQPHVIFTRYSRMWKNQRRAMHEMLRAQACLNYMPIHKAETYQLTAELLKDPESFANHTRRLTFSAMMSIVYGIRVPSSSSSEWIKFHEFFETWSGLMAPGAHMPVDAFPFLKYVPEMLAPWKKIAKDVYREEKSVFFGFLGRVQERMAKGEGNGCFAEVLLQQGKAWGIDREGANYICRALIEGGSDTTNATIQTLILFMTAHPDVQRRAQREVDALVGSDRVPDLQDIEKLPYVLAIIQETFRLRPLIPIGVPHATSGSLDCNNYIIPEGSTLVVNAWGIFHDDRIFEDPEVFKPERFINNPEATKIIDYVFGAGRRVCPGSNLAKNAVYLVIMTLLWGFNIGEAKDGAGNPVQVDLNAFVEGVTIEPKHFKCDIKPRSAKHADLLASEYQSSRRDVIEFEGELPAKDKAYLDSLTAV